MFWNKNEEESIFPFSFKTSNHAFKIPCDNISSTKGLHLLDSNLSATYNFKTIIKKKGEKFFPPQKLVIIFPRTAKESLFPMVVKQIKVPLTIQVLLLIWSRNFHKIQKETKVIISQYGKSVQILSH